MCEAYLGRDWAGNLYVYCTADTAFAYENGLFGLCNGAGSRVYDGDAAVLLFVCGLRGRTHISRFFAEKDAGYFLSKMDLCGDKYPSFLSDSLVYHAAYLRGILQSFDECGDFMHLSFPQKGRDDCAAGDCARFL